MCLNSDWTPQSCWSPMGLHRHVSLRWGMWVLEGVCRSPTGLSWVSDDNNNFVNSNTAGISANFRAIHNEYNSEISLCTWT